MSDPMYVSLYQAFLKTQENYTYYTTPKLDSYLDLETKFEELIRQTLSVKRMEWLEDPENMDKLVSEDIGGFQSSIHTIMSAGLTKEATGIWKKRKKISGSS